MYTECTVKKQTDPFYVVNKTCALKKNVVSLRKV